MGRPVIAKTSQSKSKTTKAVGPERIVSSRDTRTERLNARLTSGDQILLAKVAAMEGLSVSAFVIQAARARAKALLRRRRLIRLSARDQKALIGALLAPSEPNAALVRAAASHADESRRRLAAVRAP
jgi:uncharacterized protein (DUF1778 family)